MITVELRNGKKIVAEVKPVRGKKKDIVIVANELEYARKTPILHKTKFQCEKYIEHNFDGSLASYVVCTKFQNSKHETQHLLCQHHAQELYDYLVNSLDETTPPTPPENNPSNDEK